MLGTLARWLRILGYDTAYDRTIEDTDLVSRCLEDGRVALTKDRRLVQRKVLSRFLLIEGSTLAEQLQQVLEWTGDEPSALPLLSRCLECNTALSPLSPTQVEGRVPDYVFETEGQFSECSACGRIFWPGTHRERIQQRLKELLDGIVSEEDSNTDRP